MRTADKETAAVSVVIPSYNSAHHISETLESVFSQSYRPHEIIVVDDGSTDDTRAVLEKYSDRIIYVYQKNAGEPAARNTGIRRASGEFIAFLDADDLWLPNKLTLQMDYFEKHPEVDLVYTDMKQFNENGIVHESIKEWLKCLRQAATSFRSSSPRHCLDQAPWSSANLAWRKRDFSTKLSLSAATTKCGCVWLVIFSSDTSINR
jgi:glycosyltransferase involved in cell wall biosynthesis